MTDQQRQNLLRIAPTGMQPVLGKHLVLTRLRSDDAEYCYSLRNENEFWRHYRINQDREQSLEQIQESLAAEENAPLLKSGKIEWLINRREGDKLIPIGLAALAHFAAEQRRAEFLVGIVRAEDRTTGMGLEASLLVFDFAFNYLDLNKLTTMVYDLDNHAQKDTVALGFQQEGYLRDHLWNGDQGKFLSLYENGMLAADFRINTRLQRLSMRLLGRDITDLKTAPQLRVLKGQELKKATSDLKKAITQMRVQ